MAEHKLTSFTFQTVYLSFSGITYECCSHIMHRLEPTKQRVERTTLVITTEISQFD